MRPIILIFCFLLLITTAFAADIVRDAKYANSSDVRQAESFLASLPSACSESYAYASPDGTVIIRIICEGAGKSMDGLVSIKNGIVTQIK